MVKIHLPNQDLLARKFAFILISRRKPMLWVLIRSASLRLLFWILFSKIWILFCQSYRLHVPGQVNFLLVLREIGQVGHGVSTALTLVMGTHWRGPGVLIRMVSTMGTH